MDSMTQTRPLIWEDEGQPMRGDVCGPHAPPLRYAPDERRPPVFPSPDHALEAMDRVVGKHPALAAPYGDRSKATNPKDAVGTGKVPFSTVPARPLAEIGLAMLEGARKYGRHNYRVAGVRASVYYDAALRHLTAWWEGQDIDPDSGLPHVVKAMACLVVLRDAELNLMLTDDRPPVIANADTWIADLSDFAKQIIERYPDAKEPFTR